MIAIDTKDLKIGMFVTDLDRPWLETKFLFQGLLIENDQQIEQLRRISNTVHVDITKSLPSVSFEQFKSATDNKAEEQENHPHQEVSKKKQFEAEVEIADSAYKEASGTMHNLLTKFRLHKYVSMPEVKSCVSGVVSSVSHNPNMLQLFAAMRSKRKSTATHSVNTSILAALFGRHLQLSDEQLSLLATAALMHDVGEINTPQDILDKPEDELTAEEKTLRKQHTVHGMEILSKVQDIAPEVVEVAYAHHERVDGHGYPRGLKAEEISFMAKILAIVDRYERATNCDDVKARVSCSDGLKVIYSLRGTSLDNELVESFIKCLGVYPVGTAVQLNTGAVGVVIAVKPDKHWLPTVMIIRETSGEIRPYPRVINLDRFRDEEGRPILMIRKVIQPNELDIDICEYLLRQLGGLDQNMAEAG